MKQFLEDKVIGNVYSVRAECCQYLPDWRPWQDYKKSYTARKELGGGIILDGSHEIDYLRWFFGDIHRVTCISGTFSQLEVNVEDLAAFIFQFKNGVIGELHLDFIQRNYSRKCTIIGEHGTVIWDYSDKNVKKYDATTNEWTIYPFTNFDSNDMYIKEIEHVIDCVKHNKNPLISGVDGKKVLEIALASKKSSELARTVTL